MTRTRTPYFGAGWFNEKQTRAYDATMTASKENPTIDSGYSYVPLQNQHKGIRADERPEYSRDKGWASAIYTSGLIEIKTSNVMLGVYLPEEEDVGLGMELGHTTSRGKYVLLAIPDEDLGEPINLMSWGVCDNTTKISELKDFDFNRPRFGFYEGAVY